MLATSLFPFRLTLLKDGVKMNVHLLINPSFLDKVDTVILSNLKYASPTTEYSARKEDLIRLGRDIDPTITDDELAYIKGIENFFINFDDVISLFKKHPECRENVLVLMPNRSTDGASAVGNPNSPSQDLADLFEYRKDLYRTTNLLLSANPSDIEYFLGHKDKKPERIIPSVWGCDAHSNEAIFEPLNSERQQTKRYCWIKADPSWEGLKQVLFEPEERVKIQELCPSGRIDNYRIIDKIVIEDNNIPHRFSNESIPISENLTCIIGLKSTGKSILLQNIARAISPDDVSSQFASVYDGKKRPFEFPIKVFWKDGIVSDDKNVGNKKIVYIAQSYLNTLMDDCAEKTDIDTIIENTINQDKEFAKLKEAFSQSLILHQKTLESLILDLVYKKKELDVQNEKIKELGDRASVIKNIEVLRQKKEALAKTLDISDSEIQEFDKAVSQRIEIQSAIDEINNDKQIILLKDNIVKLADIGNIHNKEIKDLLGNITESILSMAAKAWEDKKRQLISKIDERITILQKGLAAANAVIDKLKPKIDGNAEIKKIENDLRAEEDNLRAIDKELATLTEIQREVDKTIGLITSVTTHRETDYDLFAENFKKLHLKNTDENFKIIAIKRRRRTYFQESIEKIFTQNALKTIHNGVFKNFDEEGFILESEFDEGCKKDFILAILNNDTKKVLMAKYDKSRAIQELMSDYDNIIYTVEMDSDLIENMSPGKKALVLLKLLISHDESKCPILLDQPEDDLDNLSIVSDLVSFIRERKKERQIILVTHNANLVLGCDAEEIIVANQEIPNNAQSKNKSFKFEYRSGSIENITITDDETFLGRRGIQNHICNILEGGKEAFISRKNKYTNI